MFLVSRLSSRWSVNTEECCSEELAPSLFPIATLFRDGSRAQRSVLYVSPAVHDRVLSLDGSKCSLLAQHCCGGQGCHRCALRRFSRALRQGCWCPGFSLMKTLNLSESKRGLGGTLKITLLGNFAELASGTRGAARSPCHPCCVSGK